MSVELSFGEQIQNAIDESTSTLVEPCIENTSLAWVPCMGIGLIAAMFTVTVFLIWTNKLIPLRAKVIQTLGSAAWSVLFLALEIALALFASKGLVAGATPLFITASIVACFGSVSSLASEIQGISEAADTFISGDASKSTTRSSEPKKAITPSRNTKTLTKRIISRTFNKITSWLIYFFAIVGVSVLCFIFLEMPSNPSFLSMTSVCMTCELSIVTCMVVGCWLILQRRPSSFAIPMLACAAYGIAEYFVENFKAAAIMPSDLRNIGTGISVASGYEYEITGTILLVIILFCLAAGVLVWLKDPLAPFLARKRGDATHYVKTVAASVLSIAVGLGLVISSITFAFNEDWQEKGVNFDFWETHKSNNLYGLIPSFFAALQLEKLEAPLDYTKEDAEELQASLARLYDQYIESAPERQAMVAQFEQEKPNIIFVMNESFSDLSFLGGLGVNYEGPNYVNSFDAKARGKTSVSVYGGGTCNSEFESLTGTSLGYVGAGITPYTLYDLSRIDSIPRQFKSLGYETCSIHPELATNWRRDKTLPALGFDEFIDQSSFSDSERLRKYVRDYETYDVAIDRILDNKNPQFIFDITMMGHGNYLSGLIPSENSTWYDFESVGLDKSGAAAVNEYLSSVNMIDRDIQYLISRLSEIDEPCVIVFFGDHQPAFSWWFQEEHADHSSDIAYKESLYTTDYFIWANYPIEGYAGADDEENDRDLSFGTIADADLMGWTMNFIGAPLTEYEKACFMSRWWIQSNNIFGYMDATSVWHPMHKAGAYAGYQTFEKGMQTIKEAAAKGLPDSLTPIYDATEETRAERGRQNAIMVNVMKWITYLNFAEKLK